MTDYPFNPWKVATKANFSPGNAQFAWVLTCPICQFDYNHLVELKTEPGEDSYKASWEGRGDLTTLEFWCEGCGKHWKLCLGFHKGNIYIFYRSVEAE